MDAPPPGIWPPWVVGPLCVEPPKLSCHMDLNPQGSIPSHSWLPHPLIRTETQAPGPSGVGPRTESVANRSRLRGLLPAAWEPGQPGSPAPL